MLVDDYLDGPRALSMLLTQYGYEVCAVDSGRRALEQMAAQVPHCVILDYNMPEMNGLDVLRAIRAERQYERVHVIMFTAQHDHDLKETLLAAGADAFICKASRDFAELERAVRAHCTPSREPRQRADHRSSPGKVVG